MAQLLKLISEINGVNYFKVLKTETTACKIAQICQVKNGKVSFKYRSSIEANIYKSEIGKPYIEVEKEEQEMVRNLIQSKMMDDFKLLVNVYSEKLKMVD